MEELKIWSKKNRLKSEITFNQDVNHITGRGLYSPKSVRKGEPLLQVPTGLIIDLPFILDECCGTYEFFDTYTVSRFPQKVSIPHQDIFIHFLIAEAAQKNASRVAGWISSFPRESNHLPFNWPVDIRKCVCDDSLQKAMKEEAAQFKALVSRFEHYCSVIDDVKFSRDTLAWAYSVWSSRLYELPEFPESSTQSASLPKWLERSDPTDLRSFGFLPIFDLINHSSTPNVFLNIRRKHVWDKTKKIHFSEKYLLSLEAKKNIAKGEELKLSYGDFSDRQLFLKYGFVLPAGKNKAARLEISPRLVQDTGIKTSGAYCSYDDLHVSIRERKEIVQDLHLDSFFLQKTGDELTTDLHQAALAFLLPGTTKESTILQIKERMGVNQKTRIALKHFYVYLAESIKEKLKNELAELDFRLCRERYPIKYHLVKSLKKSEIALANELFETYNNQLQILKNGEKAARPQVLSTITNLGSQKKGKEVGTSGNQNILSRLREKLAKKSKPAEESKIVSVAERSAGFEKIIEKNQSAQTSLIPRASSTRRSFRKDGRKESDSDMSIDSGYSFRTDSSKSSLLSASSIYAADRPRSGRQPISPRTASSITRSNTISSSGLVRERSPYFRRSDSIERKTRVQTVVNSYSSSSSSSPTAGSSFSSYGRYDRSYRVPSLSPNSYGSISSSTALTRSTGKYSSRLGAVSDSLNMLIANNTPRSSSDRFINSTGGTMTRLRT